MALWLRVSSLAVSRSSIRLTSIPPGLGTSNSNTVWSKAVKALVSGPKARPLRWRILTSSFSGTWVEPRNAMCSRKCASPCCSSVSCSEPEPMRRRRLVWPPGVALRCTA